MVDRRVGLDRVRVGDAAAQLVDAVLDGADDSDGRGAAERGRVPDRDDGVADLDLVGVAERERGSASASARSTWSTATSVEGSWPTTVASSWSLPEKLTRTPSGPGDHVVAREDVAGLVDDESGAERRGPRARARRLEICTTPGESSR